MDHVHKGHRERLRTKFFKNGLESFEPHEVLELLLYSVIPLRDTNLLAHNLIEKYGDLERVFEADIDDLMTVEGIGPKAAFLISFIPHISNRYRVSKWNSDKILANTDELGTYAIDMYIGKTEEEFGVICLDSNRRITSADILERGTVNEANVYPRKIIEYAIKKKAVNIVLVHNHPSGSLLPSEMDKAVTKEVIPLLSAMSINLIDHIIVSKNRFYSMMDMGNI